MNDRMIMFYIRFIFYKPDFPIVCGKPDMATNGLKHPSCSRHISGIEYLEVVIYIILIQKNTIIWNQDQLVGNKVNISGNDLIYLP